MSRDVVRCEQVSKRFGPTTALEGFSLDVRRNELLVLLGPSGCGKTTALRVMAGLERPDVGEVWVGGRQVAGAGVWVPPERRRTAMVFQEWALFPHLDVAANVAFGAAPGTESRTEEILGLAHLHGLERRMPHELSGGQQQRVAVARALASGPEVILLDEPFSNLDARLRASVRSEVREVLRGSGATAVFVTHDREEALSMADRLAVMAEGRILQVGTPVEVYAAPAVALVARLIGDATILEREAHEGVVLTPIGPIAIAIQDGPVDVLVRPEQVRLTVSPGGSGQVESVDFFGHDALVGVLLRDGTRLAARLMAPHPEIVPGTPVDVALDGAPLVFARRGARASS
jgi:iron(III) transport system ATP-binding protein